jgi:hypothetical protein
VGVGKKNVMLADGMSKFTLNIALTEKMNHAGGEFETDAIPNEPVDFGRGSHVKRPSLRVFEVFVEQRKIQVQESEHWMKVSERNRRSRQVRHKAVSPKRSKLHYLFQMVRRPFRNQKMSFHR